MPILQTIHAYTSAGRIWPIYTETDAAGRPQTRWILDYAPDPPLDTLLPAYDAILTWMTGDPQGEAYLTLCDVTIEDKLLFSARDQPADPKTERQLRTPRIVNGINIVPIRNPQFACQIQRIWEPFPLPPNLIGFLTTERPEITRKFIRRFRRSPNIIVHKVAAPPPRDFVTVERRLRTPRLQPHTLPSTAQPRELPPLPSPRPSRIETFDPSTGERLDPETGEPLDRSPCTENFIRIPVFEDIIHLTPRPTIPWLQVPNIRTGELRWTLSRTLTALEAEEFIRRREIAEQIRRSPQPEFARTVAEILTTIDDIQDALLTVIVFARLAIRRLPAPLQAVLAGGLAVADAMQLMGFGALDLVRVRAVKGRALRIHLTPRPTIPWLQVPNIRTGELRWTLSRTLTALEAEEFIRRREIAEQIRRSPQPEFARTVAEILTTIDDIQDALLTVIVFARLAIRRLPAPLQAVLAGGLAVADAMQLMGFGALDLVRVRAVKGRLMKEGNALPFTKKWKAQALRRLTRRIPTYGELVQVLQTTDQLFGVGISLGPILGFIMDILFGLGKGAQIGYRAPCLDDIRAQTVKQLEAWGKVPYGTIPPEKPPTGFLAPYKNVLDPAIQDMSYDEIVSSILVRTNPRLPTSPFTQAEFTMQLAAYNVFLDMVEETTKGENIDELTAAALDGIIKPAPELGRSATILGELDLVDATTTGRLPFPGEPTEITAADAANQTMKSAGQMLLNHYNMDPGSVPAFYMAYLAEEIGVKAIRILDPQHREPKWIPRDSWRTMDALYNRGFLPPPGATISQIQGALSALLMASDPVTAEAPSFTTMAEIVLPLGWTGP